MPASQSLRTAVWGSRGRAPPLAQTYLRSNIGGTGFDVSPGADAEGGTAELTRRAGVLCRGPCQGPTRVDDVLGVEKIAGCVSGVTRDGGGGRATLSVVQDNMESRERPGQGSALSVGQSCCRMIIRPVSGRSGAQEPLQGEQGSDAPGLARRTRARGESRIDNHSRSPIIYLEYREKTMVTNETRNAIWQELLDVARLVRYYEAMSDRYRRNHSIIRIILFLAASGEVIILLKLFPENVQSYAVSLIAGLIAIIVAVDFVCDYAKKAAVLQTISMECSRVEVEWKALWDEISILDDNDALQRNSQLARRISEITGWAGQASINEDIKLNQECTTAAYKVMKDKYATQ